MSSPADLYLCLQDDGSATAAPPRWRRLGAVALAILLLAAVPLMWASADAMATAAPKAGVTSQSDDDNSGPGGDDDDDDDPVNTAEDTATQSRDATNAANTGVSTRTPTATQSRDETQTKNTGVSTKTPTVTQSRDETQTKNTGVSTQGSR